jgi:hypothetical protein
MLVAGDGEDRHVRFVQVKHEEDARRHWSVARLIRSEGAASGIDSSIFGRLLGRDQGDRLTDFRLAINEGVDDDLQPLHYRWAQTEPEVDLSCPGATKLIDALQGWSPPTSRAIDDYVASFLLEQHSNEIADMDARVHAELAALLRDRDIRLLDDELSDVLNGLFLIVYRAGSDDERRPSEPARIVVDNFLERAMHEAEVTRLRTEMVAANPHANLRLILEQAGVDPAAARRAMDLRQRYFTAWIERRGTAEGEQLDAWLAEVQEVAAAVRRQAALEGTTEEETLRRQIDDVRRLYDGARRGATADLAEGMLYFVLSRGPAND